MKALLKGGNGIKKQREGWVLTWGLALSKIKNTWAWSMLKQKYLLVFNPIKTMNTKFTNFIEPKYIQEQQQWVSKKNHILYNKVNARNWGSNTKTFRGHIYIYEAYIYFLSRGISQLLLSSPSQGKPSSFRAQLHIQLELRRSIGEWSFRISLTSFDRLEQNLQTIITFRWARLEKKKRS